MAFGVARDSLELAETLGEWVLLARDTGSVDLACRRWVLGQGAEVVERCWSIKQDVRG